MTDVVLHRLGGVGPDVLLIHGFGADRMSWLAVAPQMCETATVWAAEYAGHGSAGNDAGDGAPQTIAAAIEAEITGRLTHPLIIGHSLGGMLALHLAASANLEIAGILLLAPAGLAGDPNGDFLHTLPELADADAALAVLQRLVVRKTLMTRRMAEAFVDTLRADGRRRALRQIAGAFVASSTPPPGPPAMPCAVLWGDADDIAPPPDRPLPGLRVIENIGHLPHIEAASTVIEAFRDLQDRAAVRSQGASPGASPGVSPGTI